MTADVSSFDMAETGKEIQAVPSNVCEATAGLSNRHDKGRTGADAVRPGA